MYARVDPDDKDRKIIEIKAFSDLDITTMTCGISFTDGELNLETIIWLLPITRVPPIVNKKRKIKIPFITGKPGAIITARYKDITRGLKRSSNETSFSHAVTIDMCGSTKSMCVKLSPGTTHICGATSKDNAEEVVHLLINKLKIAQRILELIRDYPNIMTLVVKYVEHITRSNKLVTAEEKETIKTSNPMNISIVKPVIRTLINRIQTPAKEEFYKFICDELKHTSNDVKTTDVKTTDVKTPSVTKLFINSITKQAILKVDKEPEAIKSLLNLQGANSNNELLNELYIAMSFIHSYHEEFDYHHQLHQKLKWLLRVPSFFKDHPSEIMCVSPKIQISQFKTYMVNYNFSLSFPVNRYELAKCLHGNGGFFARYDNAADHQVTVTLPLDSKNSEEKMRKKNTVDKMTWLIHRSGKVTMSTPINDSKAAEIYEELMKIIANSIDSIVGSVPLSKKSKNA
jgi:hypothetical protein